MVIIDMDIPQYCASCPLMIVHKTEAFMPTYLCKLMWQKLDGEYICKNRAGFCPMKEMEPVECELEGGGHNWWHVCGDCHGAIDNRDSYCKHCGRKIKHD